MQCNKVKEYGFFNLNLYLWTRATSQVDFHINSVSIAIHVLELDGLVFHAPVQHWTQLGLVLSVEL